MQPEQARELAADAQLLHLAMHRHLGGLPAGDPALAGACLVAAQLARLVQLIEELRDLARAGAP